MADPKNKPAPLINYAGNVMLEGEVYGGREEWGAHGGVLGRSEIVHLSGGKKQKANHRTPKGYFKDLSERDPVKLREIRKKASEGLKRYWAKRKEKEAKRRAKDAVQKGGE